MRPTISSVTIEGQASEFCRLLKLYLRIPLACRFLGQQSFLVAERIMPEAH